MILSSALLLVGCATPKPEDYGLQRVVIDGEEQYCGPREWIVPPVVAPEAADDPVYPLYRKFLALPDSYAGMAVRPRHRQACLTQALWPQWLTIRTQWNRDWPVTPETAAFIAADRAAGP